jgi:hypothetical protein
MKVATRRAFLAGVERMLECRATIGAICLLTLLLAPCRNAVADRAYYWEMPPFGGDRIVYMKMSGHSYDILRSVGLIPQGVPRVAVGAWKVMLAAPPPLVGYLILIWQADYGPPTQVLSDGSVIVRLVCQGCAAGEGQVISAGPGGPGGTTTTTTTTPSGENPDDKGICEVLPKGGNCGVTTRRDCDSRRNPSWNFCGRSEVNVCCTGEKHQCPPCPPGERPVGTPID